MHQFLTLANRYAHPKARQSHHVPEGIAKAIQECLEGRPEWPIFLFGRPGCGKSCAALAALDYVGKGGRIYYTEDDLADDVVKLSKGELTDGDGYKISARGFWNTWQNYRLAVIDEMGVRQNVSDSRYYAVKKAIDLREGKPLILISNSGPGHIAKLYDDRMASRINGGIIIKFPDIDKRVKGVSA